MAKKFNIISSESSRDTVDKVTDPPVVEKKFKFKNLNTGYNPDENIYLGLDARKYEDDVNKGDVYMPSGGIEALDRQRAENQSWYSQAGNMIGQAVIGEIVGGTIEGIGYLAELADVNNYIDGTEQQWGNFITDMGKGMREMSQEAMPIYQQQPGKFDMSDSGWWFGNGVSIASSLSMLIPSGLATKGLGMLGKGVSKGMGVISKSLDVASKMGKYESWMARGITQAVVSRHIENSMEASGTFESKRSELLGKINPKTGEIFSEEEATTLASEAAASNYRAGWAMLMQDIPQYLAIGKVFNPATMKLESVIAKATASGIKPGFKSLMKTKGAGVLGTFASEGLEESYQYYIAERGKLLSDLKAGLIDEEEYESNLKEKIGDEEMMTSAFFGGLGGSVFRAVGPKTTELFKSKSRKEYERNHKDILENSIKQRGEALMSMQLEIAKADQTGDPEIRRMAIEESLLQMTIESINTDQFDQHIEQLESMGKMSEEEKKSFEESMGIELNPEMFKQHIPKAIASANEIRKDYLKNLNRNEPFIAAKMSENNFRSKMFTKGINELDSAINEVKKEIPFLDKLSSTALDIEMAKIKLKALDFSEKHKKQRIRNSSKSGKIFFKELLDDNLTQRIELIEKIDSLKKSDERSKTEKYNDKRIITSLQNRAIELSQLEANKMQLEDAVMFNEKENALLSTKEYQEEFKNKAIERSVKKITTKDEVNSAKENLNENTEIPASEKDKASKILESKEKELEVNEKKAKAKEKQESHKEDLKKTNEVKSEVNKASIPDESINEINSDNFEDDFADEEADITSSLEEKENKALDSKFKESSENANIFGRTGSPIYKEWLINGKSKINTKISVSVGDDFGKTNAQLAIADFNKGIINENVYNYLPLKTVINNNESNYAYLSAFLPQYMDNKGYADSWANKHFPTRKSFIDGMNQSKDKKVDTKVTHQYGGKVVRSELVNGFVPENLISDMPHAINDASKIFMLDGEQPTVEMIANTLDIMFTDEFGMLMSPDKKSHRDFEGTIITVPYVAGVNKPDVPMAGTVFLNTTKADGTKFPLKLNIRKHTQDEAKLVTDLLNEIINGRAKFETPLSLLPEDLKITVNEKFKEEFDILGKDGKLIDFINLFTYISHKTKGKTSEIYLENSWVKFDQGKSKLTPEITTKEDSKGKSADEQKEDLVQFLLTKKRRQIDLKMWASSDKYRTYIIGKGILSTDATTKGPLFGTDGPELDVYIAAPKVSVKKTEASTTSNEIDIIEAKKNSAKSKPTEYVTEKGKKENIVRKTEEESLAVLNELYEKQALNAKIAEDVAKLREFENKSQEIDDSVSDIVDENSLSSQQEIVKETSNSSKDTNESLDIVETINESTKIEDNLIEMSFDEDIEIEISDEFETSFFDGLMTTDDFHNEDEDGFDINCTD